MVKEKDEQEKISPELEGILKKESQKSQEESTNESIRDAKPITGRGKIINILDFLKKRFKND